MFKRNRSVGMTLIECMLGCALTLIVLGIVFKIFLIAQNNYQVQKNILLIQYNENIIKNMFDKNVHQAGFIGCAKLNDHFPLINHSKFFLQKNNKISPYPGIHGATDSDGLQIWYAENHNINLQLTMRNLSKLSLTTDTQIQPNDVLIISDCESADVFVVQQVLSSRYHLNITSAQPLSKLYPAGAEVYTLSVNKFFLAKNVDDTNGLFWRDIHGTDVELAHQIKKMKINYLIANQNSFSEKSAAELNPQDDIRGVTIYLQFFTKIDANFYQDWFIYAASRQY